MYGRAGLERFKKAESTEPFSVSGNSAPKTTVLPATKTVTQPSVQYSQSKTQSQFQDQPYAAKKPEAPEAGPLLGHTQPVTQVGGGQSTWQPPDWAIEPRPGVYYLEVLKDKEVLDRINLDRRRHIFGRQIPTCDFVLDHQSVSRQHAVVVPHRNGSIFVIDLGSAHGTFVANERLTKDTPVVFISRGAAAVTPFRAGAAPPSYFQSPFFPPDSVLRRQPHFLSGSPPPVSCSDQPLLCFPCHPFSHPLLCFLLFIRPNQPFLCHFSFTFSPTLFPFPHTLSTAMSSLSPLPHQASATISLPSASSHLSHYSLCLPPFFSSQTRLQPHSHGQSLVPARLSVIDSTQIMFYFTLCLSSATPTSTVSFPSPFDQPTTPTLLSFLSSATTGTSPAI